MQHTYWDIFSTAQNSFSDCRFWCLLVLLPFFVSPLPHQQNISPWGLFFSQGNKNKVTQGEVRWIGRVGHRGHAAFGQKLLNTQCGVGRCARKSPTMKWANRVKVFKKHSLQPYAASHNNAIWYADTDRFLQHSPNGEHLYYKGPALQKIIPVFRRSPHMWEQGLYEKSVPSAKFSCESKLL